MPAYKAACREIQGGFGKLHRGLVPHVLPLFQFLDALASDIGSGGLSLADCPRRWTAASAKSCAATLTATIQAPVAVPNRGQSASDSPPAVEAAALPATPGTGPAGLSWPGLSPYCF